MTTLPLAVAMLLLLVGSARADDPAVQKYLDGVKEKTELHGTALGDVDGDGTDEVVFVWGTLAKIPTKTLTVLARTDGGYRELASRKLDGEVSLGSVASGIIIVDRWPLHPPKCCPSKKFQDRYLLLEGRLVDAK